MSVLEGYVEGMINLEGGGGGTSDYTNLQNKPSINNVELVGNKTTEDLNISYNDLQNKPTIRNMPDSSGAAAGDVLTHTASGDEWQPPVKELPAYTSENNKYLKVVNGSLEWSEASGGGSYSTSEQVIGTWIDGSTLYQRTFDLRSQTLSNNNWNYDILGTAGSGINIKSFEGYFGLDSATNIFAPYNYFRSTSIYFTATVNDAGDDLSLLPNMPSDKVYAGLVTIKYVKVS